LTLSIFSNVPYNLRSQLLPEILMVLAAAGVVPAWIGLAQHFPPMARRTAGVAGALALVALGLVAIADGRSFVTSLGDQQLEWAMLERTVPQLPPHGTLLSAVDTGGRNLDAFPQFLLARAEKQYELVD